MQQTIKSAIEVGVVAAPASYAAGVYPSIGDYPLFILAEHVVTPDFILRIMAMVVAMGMAGLALHKYASSRVN